VKYLHTLDWVDPERIGVFGGSFGGFATLSCVSRLPDYWAAAVDIVGPSNLVTFAKAVPPTWRRFMTQWVGDPETEVDFLLERSPITYVEQIKAPLFIIQGANDPRVVQARKRPDRRKAPRPRRRRALRRLRGRRSWLHQARKRATRAEGRRRVHGGAIWRGSRVNARKPRLEFSPVSRGFAKERRCGIRAIGSDRADAGSSGSANLRSVIGMSLSRLPPHCNGRRCTRRNLSMYWTPTTITPRPLSRRGCE
jgi:pimeloyl-ACP methyl ester carboxylesterase